MSVAFQRKFYQPLAIAAALAFVYFTVLVKLGRDWWSDENYSHGLLVPFVIGYILWHERKRLAAAQIQPQVWLGVTGVVVSLVMLWAGVAGAELFVQRMSIAVMLASVAIYFWGFRLLRLLAVPLGRCSFLRFRFPKSSLTRSLSLYSSSRRVALLARCNSLTSQCCDRET